MATRRGFEVQSPHKDVRLREDWPHTCGVWEAMNRILRQIPKQEPS